MLLSSGEINLTQVGGWPGETPAYFCILAHFIFTHISHLNILLALNVMSLYVLNLKHFADIFWTNSIPMILSLGPVSMWQERSIFPIVVWLSRTWKECKDKIIV